jgi:VCBS repeat-containing protein
VPSQLIPGGSIAVRSSRRGVTAAALAIGLALAPAGARHALAVATAVDDPFYTVNEDETLLVDAPGVLANDTDDGGAAICVATVDDSGIDGTLEWGHDGSFTFTPNADFNGPTSFTYGARAGDGDCVGAPEGAAATVTITVNPVNDRPTAKADTFQALPDRTLTVPAPGILSNDGDLDGDLLTAQKVTDPAHGIVNLASNGGFSYTPTAGYLGPDGFSYRASDGTETSPVRVVSITVTAVPTVPPPTVAPTATP